METSLEFKDKWIDAEIIGPPYNELIEVCYYDIYDDYDGSGEFYDDCCYQLVEDILIYKLDVIDFIHKWKPFRKLETNG